MLKKLVISAAILLLSNPVIAHDNLCAYLAGKWSGTWEVIHTYYHCTWNAEVSVSSKNNDVLYNFEVKLTNPNHKHLCKKEDHLIMEITCNDKGDGKAGLSFPAIKAQGILSGDYMTLFNTGDDLLHASLYKN